ncbi:MAG: type II toxin-antitoxin system RelE/ParE family toxin [Candidatus Gracilibacteria bacterium]|jgi:mRNA interferase RelE/StbE
MGKSLRDRAQIALEKLTDPVLFHSLNIKKLRAPKEGYRLRVGDYRILFIKEQNLITIHDVGHRKDVYK